jgi:hypothetical protein
MAPNEAWLESLRTAALEFCQTVAIINGPPDVRPWNESQVVWKGSRAPDPSDPVFAYHQLEPSSKQVAILGGESRVHFSEFITRFEQQADYRDAYSSGFLRDILTGLLQLSLPDAPITPVPSPYWKRYVAGAVAQLRAGSPERYAEAVVTAIRSLPVPHADTIVVIPLAGVHLLGPTPLASILFIPDAACSADPDLAHCGMFLHRLKELRTRADGLPLTFAKLHIGAEPGRAVQRAVVRTEQICRMLRLLPNPGLAEGPLADPPRIDLDASDSAAFYIAETSVGTHPIPVRRSTSEPQGRLANWRVEPRLRAAPWQRLARIIETGAQTDIEARLLTGLRHLGEAMAEPSAAVAVDQALDAVIALLGTPGISEPRSVTSAVGRLAARGEPASMAAARYRRTAELGEQLVHDLDTPVSPEQRAAAIWLAFNVLESLLERPSLIGYRDLELLLAQMSPS